MLYCSGAFFLSDLFSGYFLGFLHGFVVCLECFGLSEHVRGESKVRSLFENSRVLDSLVYSHAEFVSSIGFSGYKSNFEDEILFIIDSLKPDAKVKLAWRHDYVTKDQASFPERPITKIEAEQ